MVRFILVIILILFVVWIIQPFLRAKDNSKAENRLEGILNSNRGNFGVQNFALILISAVILLALVIWILPRFGINFLGLLQKIFPIISSLRGILPF